MSMWKPTRRSVDEIRYWFAKREWMRCTTHGAGVISEDEYALLQGGVALPKSRMRDLRCFIDGYERAKR